MILTGIARLGRNAETRFTTNGDAVANLALAFNYGKRGEDGNRPTQWIDGSLWGKRAEALAQHLIKGTAVYVALEDIHIETYEGKNGSGAKLVARVLSLEFAGGKSDSQGDSHGRSQSPQRQQAAAPKQGGAFGDFDDDIPFEYIGRGMASHVI